MSLLRKIFRKILKFTELCAFAVGLVVIFIGICFLTFELLSSYEKNKDIERLFEQAQKGDSLSQYSYAKHLLHGNELPEAIKWFKMAAEQHHKESEFYF